MSCSGPSSTSGRVLELTEVPAALRNEGLAVLLKEFENDCKYNWISSNKVLIAFANNTKCLKAKEKLSSTELFKVNYYCGNPHLVPDIPLRRPNSSGLTVYRMVTRTLGVKQQPDVVKKNNESFMEGVKEIEKEKESRKESQERQRSYWDNTYDK